MLPNRFVHQVDVWFHVIIRLWLWHHLIGLFIKLMSGSMSSYGYDYDIICTFVWQKYCYGVSMVSDIRNSNSYSNIIQTTEYIIFTFFTFFYQHTFNTTIPILAIYKHKFKYIYTLAKSNTITMICVLSYQHDTCHLNSCMPVFSETQNEIMNSFHIHVYCILTFIFTLIC